jgi:CPA2 family monovalent cation:H+ antiporter-2
VVLPILAARDELGSPFARRFLGVSLFQDFALIPLLLLVPALAPAGDGTPAVRDVLLRVAVAVVGVVALIAVARYVAPPLFSGIARLGSREAFTGAAIVVVVGTIAAADALGISAAIGAFAAGVVIGDTDYIHEIAGILRPFRDFLSALFFASIGMLFEPEFALRNWGVVLIAVVAVIGIKVAAAYPAMRISSVSRTAIRTAFALAPVGEFSFLLAQEGKQVGIVEPAAEQLFVSVAVVTLAVTPLLVVAGRWFGNRLHSAVSTSDTDARLERHIIIVGYGLNGQNVARILAGTAIPFVILEEDPERIEAARERRHPVIFADAADPGALRAAGIERALGVVIAISDAGGTRHIVRVCRALAPDVRIIVRTRYVKEVETLKDLGADEIIPEEFETSIEIIMRVLHLFCLPGNIIAAQLRILRDEGYRMLRDAGGTAAAGRRLSAIVAAGTSEIFLVMPDSAADGRTLTDLALDRHQIAVPALLRDGKPITPPPLDEPLQAGDSLLLVGAHDDLLRAVARLEKPLTS